MWSFVLVKQRTAYEMRISDWRSDVCSSDLAGRYYGTLGRASYATCGRHPGLVPGSNVPQALAPVDSWMPEQVRHAGVRPIKASVRDKPGRIRPDRKMSVLGKSVAFAFTSGRQRSIEKKKIHDQRRHK